MLPRMLSSIFDLAYLFGIRWTPLRFGSTIFEMTGVCVLFGTMDFVLSSRRM